MIVTPRTSYIICAVPRSGSYLLCEALRNTGLAGSPSEHFEELDAPPPYVRWSLGKLRNYTAPIVAREIGPNGVFGVKTMWSWFAALSRQLEWIAGDHGGSFHSLMNEILPNTHYLYITRRDTVRQGISLARAMQSRVYVLDGDEQPSPKSLIFDFDQIDEIVKGVRITESLWEAWFEAHDIPPFRVVYEDFVADYEGTALAVLRYLGIPFEEPVVFGERRMRKQADAESEEWVRRYLEMRAQRLPAGVTPFPIR